MKKIAYLRSTSIVNDSRAMKEIESYSQRNYKLMVLGWNRQNISIENNDSHINYYFYNKKSEYGKGYKNMIKLIQFQIWLYNTLKKNRDKYDIIHACDFDTAFVAEKICKKYKKKLVYDIYDYYVDCHSLSFLKKYVEKKDIRIINKADLVIICTEQRRKQISKACPKDLIVVYNTPSISVSQKISKLNNNKIKIGYVGILQDNRLLKEIFEKIKGNSRYEFYVGGFGLYENYIKELSCKYKNIKFYGSLSYSETLKLEEKVDVLFATYNPDVQNHKYSAPNKVFEAMALGKPIIVCKNTGVDEMVVKEKIGYVIKYDVDDFVKCLENLKNDEYQEISKIAKKLYISKYTWEKMAEILCNKVEKL